MSANETNPRVNGVDRLVMRLFSLPEPASQDTYDNGEGAALPALAYRRWKIWAPTVITSLFVGVPTLIASVVRLSGAAMEDAPIWVFPLTFLAACVVIALSYTLNKVSFLMYEYRFDDLGLHIRRGMGTIQENTISYRNIQNVSIQRNPVDLLLGLSKVIVETAGGGGGEAAAAAAAAGGGGAAAMAMMMGHRGLMMGVDRYVAEDIRRDLEERMRQFHGSGLGDNQERRRKAAKRGAVVATASAGLAPGHVELLRQTLESLRGANEALHRANP